MKVTPHKESSPLPLLQTSNDPLLSGKLKVFNNFFCIYLIQQLIFEGESIFPVLNTSEVDNILNTSGFDDWGFLDDREEILTQEPMKPVELSWKLVAEEQEQRSTRYVSQLKSCYINAGNYSKASFEIDIQSK